jgi:hypothetical protein
MWFYESVTSASSLCSAELLKHWEFKQLQGSICYCFMNDIHKRRGDECFMLSRVMPPYKMYV